MYVEWVGLDISLYMYYYCKRPGCGQWAVWQVQGSMQSLRLGRGMDNTKLSVRGLSKKYTGVAGILKLALHQVEVVEAVIRLGRSGRINDTAAD